MNGSTLVVISPLRGFPLPNGNIILTQKFVDGMKLYRELWGGPILHLCAPADQPSDNLDNIEVAGKTPEFDTVCAPLTPESLKRSIPVNSVVLTSVGEDFNSVSAVGREIGVPCVYVTEYSLKTRLQIITENQRNPARGAWQKLRQIQQEVAQRKAMSIAAGVQCNGLPTFNKYRRINSGSLLFFDNRTEAAMLATEDQVRRRSFQNRMGKKLRMVFSGRLNLMKGVDDLLTVAENLREPLRDWFEFSIFGDGDYCAQLERDIKAKGLSDLVKLRGTLDFKSELVPIITEEADLFVCCHRQGDPSCTYLETMACGVPIIGYANEAWSDLSSFSKTGWVIPISNPKAMTDRIVALANDPISLEDQAMNSLAFAQDHTFEKTFKRRVEHLKEIAQTTRY